VKPAPFEYCAPGTVEEAFALLARHGADARPLAGGQSLVPMLALRLARPSALIDLNRIVELGGIRVIDDELCIGAMTRQVDALRSEVVVARAPLLVQALRFVGHPPTRARGTIGGSLAHADPAAELPAALLALDGTLVVRNAHGTRTIQAEDFFQGPFSTALEDGELLVEIRIPTCGAGGSAFKEIAPREGDFALVSVAARLEFDEERRCKLARVVLGAVGANAPVRCPAVEDRLLGQSLHEALIAEAAAVLPSREIEFDTWMASRAYRAQVAPVLARRAIAAAAGLAERPS
jgi:aerobic carbon-monoxide dehydrogenase medium subunit